MTSLHFADWTWTEIRDLDLRRLVAILPVGAVEAHGPHLPLSTDRVIALAMAEEGARQLGDRGVKALVLPPLDYTSASFAAGFPGTLSLRGETVTAVIRDLAAGLDRHGVGTLALANAHLDPGHLQSLYDAVGEIRTHMDLEVAFPDVTRKPWALRLTDEFKSGACHAGRYEGSVVLARRPDLVRRDRLEGLEENPVSLSRAIWQGHRTFEEAGGPEAYFGDPAAATADEGETTVGVLGGILAAAVLELVEAEPSAPGPRPVD
ncbi:MAG: creatininase family protein [Acidobacteriota bacterium]